MATDAPMTAEKNHGKIPKRIHKAEREKMKREHLNELFLALANSLELSDQNAGKASVLIEASRLVRDMLSQIKCLKEENAALLSETQYVTSEKNELKDENSALEAQIGKLQIELKSRVPEMQLDLNIGPPDNQSQELASRSDDGPLIVPPQPGQPQGQIVNPLHVATFCSNVQAYPTNLGTEQQTSRHVSVVSKPLARYPTPADTWPFQILEKQPELGK